MSISYVIVTTSHDDAINLMETSTSTNCFPVTSPYGFSILLPMLLTNQLSDDQKYKALTDLERRRRPVKVISGFLVPSISMAHL